MKKYKTTIIITTLITLLPIVIGLFLWNKLPVHWQHIGEATEPQTDGPAKHFLSSECRSS